MASFVKVRAGIYDSTYYSNRGDIVLKMLITSNYYTSMKNLFVYMSLSKEVHSSPSSTNFVIFH